jgi:alcohol dehydrogenase
MTNFTYNNMCKIIFGTNAVDQLGAECTRFGKRILLVTGGKSIHASGLYTRVMELLKKAECTVFEVSGIQPNPRLSSVYEGISVCKKEKVDFILAVGGGSVIDASKAMAAGALFDGDVWNFYERKAEVKSALPTGNIITLAATGSESNKNSVITNWDTKQKLGLGHPLLIPQFSLIDPSLTATVPLDQTVNGIVDIMAHVFEQYFSPTPSTYLLDRMAEAVLKTVVAIAPQLIDDLKNYELRSEIMWSSTIALNGSLSCGKSGDFASHMIEHELSAIYDIPHGAGLSIVFPNWMKYVMDTNIEKFVAFARNVWNVSVQGKNDRKIALEGIQKTRDFFTAIGAPAALSHYSIGEENIPVMAEKCCVFGPVGSFKPLNKNDVEAILKSCL